MPSKHESVCPLDCPDTCSLAVTVEEGRVTRVDASDRNPFTAGFICAKVRRYAERVYSPLRLLYPQRRVGPKGEGNFERIAWEEAIELVAGRLRRIVEESGAEAILPYHYGGSNGLLSEGGADARFFHRLGASHLLRTICAAPTGAAYQAMYGTMGGVPMHDYRHARAILLWGVNPSTTGIHLVPHVNAARRAGAFVAVVDPRRTPLARSASVHLQPLPGTDVVLALAMIAALAERGAVDRAFVDAHTNGFDALLAAARQFTPAQAARTCQVPERDILAVVDAYAAASPAVLRCGWGVERNRNGGNAARAILALPAVAGKFGVRGGGLSMSLSRPFPINTDALERPDLAAAPVRRVNMTQLGRMLTQPQTPPVRALFVYNANPAVMVPDQNEILRGLAREDLFTVVHEQVMTDTARFADVLLPATTVFEQEELHKAYGHFFLQYSHPVIEPVGESLSNVELFARLSRAMGFDAPALAAGPAQLTAAALEGAGDRLGGVTAEELRRTRIAPLRFEGGTEAVQFVTTFPTTASRKVELSPPELGRLEYAPPSTTAFPLVLLSPASDKTINSTLAEYNVHDPRLQMNAADAEARGIADGDEVRAYNHLGEVHVRADVGDDIRPGVVALAKGLWREHTLNGATSTALIPDDLTDIGGGACFNDARVEVERLR